jgi:hypothetical protein
MTKSRKGLLFAVTALLAVAALVGAASALAGVWKHEGKELKEKVTLPLSGGEVIEVGSSVLICNTTATLTTEGGSTAQVTAFAVEKGSCIGVAGEFEGCEVTAATPNTLPWSVSVGSETLTAKGFGVSYTLNAGCPITSVATSYPELTLTPEEPSAIKFFHFGQTGTGKVNGASTSITDGGVWQLEAADSEKYGIG